MKILGWIITTSLIVLALYVLLRFALCRPNYFTIKTATPMAEKIADYIVEHGVPESLDKIPDLPYKLAGCKRKIESKRVDLKNIKVSAEEAESSVIDETCFFFTNQDSYRVWFWFSKTYSSSRPYGRIDIQSGKTSVITNLKTDENNTLTHDQTGAGFDKRFGFCMQFKQ